MNPSLLVAPTRRASPVAAAAVGVALVGAAALVAVRDPNEPGSYGVCPLRLATGLDCPACGSLRAAHALLGGDIGGALGSNVLLVLAVPLMLFHYLAWARPSWTGPARAAAAGGRLLAGRRGAWVLAAVVVAFTVLRNVPSMPFAVLHS